PERLPLAEDREPRQPGLETLEAQLLEQAAVAGDGEPPLRAVVGAVYLGLGSPPAAMPPVGADHGRVHGASMPPDRRSVAVVGGVQVEGTPLDRRSVAGGGA